MEILKRIPFFLFLIVIFFCLHGYVQAPQFLHFQDILKAGFNVSIIISVVFLVSYLFTKNIILSSFVCFYFEVWYLFFGAFQDTFKPPFYFSFLSRYSVIVPLILVFAFFYTKFLKQKKHLWPKISLYLNLLLCIYIFIDIIELIKVKKSYINTPNIQFDYNAKIKKDDVYFLLFDGYPGNYELNKRFDFSNNEFDVTMKKNGFKAMPISANYDVTFYSMASIFNMNYVVEKGNSKHTQSDIGKRLAEIQNGEVFKIFSKLGYKIENNSIFDINNIPSISNDNRFLNGGGILLTDKIFLNRLKKDLAVGFFAKFSNHFEIFQNLSIYKNRNDNENMVQNLLSKLPIKYDQPVFSYTHLLMPHEPFYYDSLGNKIDYVKNSYLDKLNASDFISYLKYTNKLIDKIVTAIKIEKPNSIIILMSDHGQRGLNDLKIIGNDKLNNICHIYFPNNQYGSKLDTLTNVNVFRYLFNTQFNQNLPLKRDTSFLFNDDF